MHPDTDSRLIKGLHFTVINELKSNEQKAALQTSVGGQGGFAPCFFYHSWLVLVSKAARPWPGQASRDTSAFKPSLTCRTGAAGATPMLRLVAVCWLGHGRPLGADLSCSCRYRTSGEGEEKWRRIGKTKPRHRTGLRVS